LVERLGIPFFRSIPEQPGVYRFLGADDSILYVGKAKNLRDRLGSYRSLTGQSTKTRRLIQRAVRIEWDLCADEGEALVHEARLIRSIQPRFNRAGVWSAPPWKLQIQDQAKEWVFSAQGIEHECAGGQLIGPLRAGHKHLIVVLLRMLWLAEQGFPEPHRLPRILLFPEIRWTEIRISLASVVLPLVREFLKGENNSLLVGFVERSESAGSPFVRCFVQADLERLQYFWDHHPLRAGLPSVGNDGAVARAGAQIAPLI
jgi:hypothetical protein